MSELINRELVCSRSICYDIECDFCPFADADGVCKLRERVYALPTVVAVPTKSEFKRIARDTARTVMGRRAK